MLQRPLHDIDERADFAVRKMGQFAASLNYQQTGGNSYCGEGLQRTRCLMYRPAFAAEGMQPLEIGGLRSMRKRGFRPSLP
jgi:hypothetical protein